MAQTVNPALGGHLLAYSGVPTFMRQTPTRDLSGADVAIVGVSFDSGATSFRGGTRFGPRKIREASLALWGHHHIHGVAPTEALNIVDYGDVAIEMAYIEKTMAAITAEVGAALAQGPMVVALGGDHSISLPLLRAQAAVHGPLALIHFDAHTDVEPGGFSSYQMFQLMRGLKGLNLVGMDIVEVSPPYDHADVTAILAANLVFEYLCLVALKRGGAGAQGSGGDAGR